MRDVNAGEIHYYVQRHRAACSGLVSRPFKIEVFVSPFISGCFRTPANNKHVTLRLRRKMKHTRNTLYEWKDVPLNGKLLPRYRRTPWYVSCELYFHPCLSMQGPLEIKLAGSGEKCVHAICLYSQRISRIDMSIQT